MSEQHSKQTTRFVSIRQEDGVASWSSFRVRRLKVEALPHESSMARARLLTTQKKKIEKNVSKVIATRKLASSNNNGT